MAFDLSTEEIRAYTLLWQHAWKPFMCKMTSRSSKKSIERKYTRTYNERGQRIKPAFSRLMIIGESSDVLIWPVHATLHKFGVIRTEFIWMQ